MIAIDASPLVWQPRTGVARALEQLLLGWSRRPDAAALVLLAPGPVGEAAHGLPLHRAGRAATRSPRAWRRALAALVADVRARAFFSPWSAFPALRVPTVALVHELPFVRHGPIEGRFRARAHRTWLRRDVRDCAAIVVPSQATAADVLALHPQAAERLHVIPNGFDPMPWERPATPAAKAPGTVLMLGVGRGRAGARKKGLDVLLAAWGDRGAANERLVLVGRPALPLPGGVRVEADVDDARLRHLLAEAGVLVYPSRSEGFGYPPLEAMAAGVPVLTTDAGSIPEVVGDAARVVATGDPQALGAALSALEASDAERAQLVAAGRERARQFPPEPTSARLEAVLDRVREEA